ncbi:hypothetical protein [Xenorhabdus innexi]|uniref:Uncharacterized protein n=1 Tax=Xenorhabdus innexi TaxID=290109 RepID=A0A1N6N1L0_9GAMM|nr:hypothetical protein [Xenorhabdus innexi]PHM29097.1 hypothetical protein Xinn_03716 [Xenorhabdus innexi]SIP74965.1 conserved hypothetical protein [Xenorhabdus innexi]
MVAKLTITPSSGNIIVGQAFEVLATVVGETASYDPTKVNVSLLTSKGLKIEKAFPGEHTTGGFKQRLVISGELIDHGTNQQYTQYTAKFTVNTPSNPSTSVSYTAINNPSLDPDSCVLGITSFYLYDQKPVQLTGPKPNPSVNSFVLASINPMTDGSNPPATPLTKYDLTLRVSAPVRIFLKDQFMTECLPYSVPGDGSNQEYYFYLINKPTADAVNLQIFATDQIASKVVDFKMIFSDVIYDANQSIFMTTQKINVLETLEVPSIKETGDTDKLERPLTKNEFHYQVPVPPQNMHIEYILGFSTAHQEHETQKQLFISKIDSVSSNNTGYYTFAVPYNELNIGRNYISYILSSKYGNSYASKYNFIHYDNNGNNNPASNTGDLMLMPKVLNSRGYPIAPNDTINVPEIGTKGLEVLLPYDRNNPKHTIAPNDIISITVSLSNCQDTITPARPLIFKVKDNVTVHQNDLNGGYYKANISPQLLLGFETTDSASVGTIAIEYERTTSPKKSVIYVRSFDTYVG